MAPRGAIFLTPICPGVVYPAKFVMPGRSSLHCTDRVNLSAMPGIHVYLHLRNKDVDGRDEPGRDEKQNR
jgi:hypothetical protein